jgi:fructose-specific phosphotransferase system IIA component
MEIAEILPYFSKDRFVPELKAATKESAIEELAEKFVETDLIRNKDILLEMLHRRESVGSTGIGHGIAVPHGRTTATADLTVAFGKSKRGLKWDSIDEQPVHLIFLIVAPPYEEKNKYLPMLGTLVEFLSQEENRRNLLATESFETFKELLTQ